MTTITISTKKALELANAALDAFEAQFEAIPAISKEKGDEMVKSLTFMNKRHPKADEIEAELGKQDEKAAIAKQMDLAALMVEFFTFADTPFVQLSIVDFGFLKK